MNKEDIIGVGFLTIVLFWSCVLVYETYLQKKLITKLEQRIETLKKGEPVYIYMCPQEPEMEIVDPLRNYA